VRMRIRVSCRKFEVRSITDMGERGTAKSIDWEIVHAPKPTCSIDVDSGSRRLEIHLVGLILLSALPMAIQQCHGASGSLTSSAHGTIASLGLPREHAWKLQPCNATSLHMRQCLHGQEERANRYGQCRYCCRRRRYMPFVQDEQVHRPTFCAIRCGTVANGTNDIDNHRHFSKTSAPRTSHRCGICLDRYVSGEAFTSKTGNTTNCLFSTVLYSYGQDEPKLFPLQLLTNDIPRNL
jgi:hypothetical protein